MKIIKLIPFILIIIGTVGLLAIELLAGERGDFLRKIIK